MKATLENSRKTNQDLDREIDELKFKVTKTVSEDVVEAENRLIEREN